MRSDVLAGQIQSPTGRRALNSTRPKRMLLLSRVEIRALLIGGITLMLPLVLLLNATQSICVVPVQVPAAVRSKMRLLVIASRP